MSAHFSVLGLDHVDVTAPEELENEVVDWYQNCLGLTRVNKPAGTRPRGAWFELGPQELHVSIDEHNPHHTAHVGILVDDFDAVVERLRGAGCHLEQAATLPGRRRCYTRDPAGNRIEIGFLEEPTAHIVSEESG
ncbi:MAG: VOC family protein [Actinomycetota bacterium]|nr:VOC family protein [Actinomycetota bacterium]